LLTTAERNIAMRIARTLRNCLLSQRALQNRKVAFNNSAIASNATRRLFGQVDAIKQRIAAILARTKPRSSCTKNMPRRREEKERPNNTRPSWRIEENGKRNTARERAQYLTG